MIRKFYLKAVLLLLLFVAAGSSYGQSLNGIPGLVLWLRADSGVVTIAPGDTTVTTWRDISGNNDSAVSMPGLRPTLITAPTLNNKPAIKFDGHTQFLTGAPITALNSQTNICGEYEFIVCKADSAETGLHGGVFTIDTNYTLGMWLERLGSYELFINNIATNQGNAYILDLNGMPNSAFPYKLFEVRKLEGISATLDINTAPVGQILEGANGGPQMCGPFTNGPYNIGFAPGFGGTDGYFGGEFAEIIMYAGGCLTGGQIQQVETYLGTKYSPPVHIGPRDTTILHSVCPLTLTVPATGFSSFVWSTGATTNSITVSKSGTYSVSFKDGFGATQYDTTTVTFPVVTLHPAYTLCQGSNVKIVPNLDSLSNCTYHWNNGQTTDTISVTAAGIYFLTVTDANNCTVRSDTETVVVDAFASTVSLGPAATLCSGNHLNLATPATGWNKLQFLWSTGSADSVIWINTSAVYSVTVTDTIGCTGTASVNVTIAGVAPHVNFTTPPVCQGLAYTPANLSDNLNDIYTWNFGDGNDTSNLFSPSHIYHAAGVFPVELTVKDTLTGCAGDSIIADTVNGLPTAAFQSAISCQGFYYTFVDLSGPAAGQAIGTYYWNFNDQYSPVSKDTSYGINPNHLFDTTGTYHIVLTITQTNGCAAIDSTDSLVVQVPAFAPGAAVPEFPANSSISADSVVTFGWTSATSAEFYDLLVSTDPSFSFGDSSWYNIFSNQKTVALPGNKTYYWKVVAVNPCGVTNLSPVDTFGIYTPANIDFANLAFWLRADAGVVRNGSTVSQWMDQSLSQAVATTMGSVADTFIPHVALLDYKPSISFPTNAFMSGPSIAGLGALGTTDQNSLSIFIVARADGPLASGEPGGIFTIGGLGTGMWIERGNTSGFTFINSFTPPHYSGSTIGLLSAMPNTACPYHLYGIQKQINSYVNIDTNSQYAVSDLAGVDGTPYLLGTFQDSVFCLGHPAGTDPYGNGAPYGYLNGEIAEIIVYNTLLNTQQTQLVNNYLFNKYAPPVNLGPDIVQNYSLCPVTLHTGNRFVSYLWNTGATSDTLNVTQSGTYWVSAIDVFNRTSFDSIHVSLPYQGVNPDTDYVCFGDTGQITQLINNPGGYTYVWYDSVSASSVTNLNINSNIIQPYSAGYYYTRITDNAHCSITTRKVPVIIDNFYSAQLLPAYDTICKFGTILINTVPYTIDTFLWLPIADTMSQPTIDSSGMYYLRTVDNHGCINYDSTRLTTHAQAPVTNFAIPNFCLSDTTYFIDSSFAAPGDSILSYHWNYGGGLPVYDTTVNGKTSYRTNYGYGNYTVVLTLTTDSGCVGVKTKHISILPSPVAGYLYSANNSVYPYILCAGPSSSAQFTDTSSSPGGSAITERFWSFNGVTSPDHNPTIQYSFPDQGLYTISLEVVNTLGCADSITQHINVYPAFTAAFSYNGQCLGDTTIFKDLTPSLSIISRLWKFRENGDGPYAYTPTVHFPFSHPGTFDVELQLENAIGCISTVDQQVKIVQKPVADFTDTTTCLGKPYKPVDNSYAFNDTLVGSEWTINGHGYTDALPIVFTDTGRQVVNLTVTSSEGCVDSVTKIINVVPVPTALFSFNPLYGTAPLAVNFNNLSTGATNYLWQFGDGGSATTTAPGINPPAYTYNQNGNYNIVLYAYNGQGCYDSLSRLITIIPTVLDIAIQQVSTVSVTLPDGSQLVTLTCLISNVGTRIITSAQLYATLGGSGIMEQNWTGYLLSGQTISSTFPAQFVVEQGANNTFVCVRATDVNNGEPEIDTANNVSCASLNGRMQLSGPQPDPAVNYSILGIILPNAGTVYISVMDETGKYIVPESSFSLPQGRTDYTIPVTQLAGAEYFIRVRYNDDIEIRKFVVR